MKQANKLVNNEWGMSILTIVVLLVLLVGTIFTGTKLVQNNLGYKPKAYSYTANSDLSLTSAECRNNKPIVHVRFRLFRDAPSYIVSRSPMGQGGGKGTVYQYINGQNDAHYVPEDGGHFAVDDPNVESGISYTYYVETPNDQNGPGTFVIKTPQCSSPTAQPVALPVVALVTPARIDRNDEFITFAWNAKSGLTGQERINLYELGTANTSPALASIYISCTGGPGPARQSGSCQIFNVFKDPTKNYEFRMFAQDGITVITKSNPFAMY